MRLFYGCCRSSRTSRHFPALAIALVLIGGLAGAPALAATIYANPGDSINSKINSMGPGDTLILNPGTYNTAGVTMMLITNKVGRPDAWYTIKAVQPGTVVIKGNSGRNTCEMRNSAYWRFENLVLDGQGLASDGIKATVNTGVPDTDWCHDIVIDGVEMRNLPNAAVNTQVTVWNLTVRNCWFHDVGLAGYLGSPDHVQQIINLVWEHNLVERTYGYGMQVKAQNVRSGLTLGQTPGLEFTSWGWRIKDNVYMRTSPPASSARPCLLVDAGPASGSGSTDLATIDGNVVLAQTADSTADNAFQLSGNLRVINNILMNCKGSTAIRIGFHDITYPRQVEVINNTVFIDGSSGGPCLAVSSLQSGYTQVIANNAFIRGSTSTMAVSASVLPGTIVTNNIVRGTGAVAGMTTITAPVDRIFASTTDVPGTADFYPVAGSPLLDAGSNTYASADDFNGIARPQGTGVDVGAYERCNEGNPGWQLAVAAKRLTLTGDIDGDGTVDVIDLLSFAPGFGTVSGDPNYSVACDFNSDSSVDVVDLLIFVNSFGLTSDRVGA